MQILTIQCPKCFALLFSRNLNDSRQCECGKITVSGGIENLEVHTDSAVSPLEIFVDLDEEISPKLLSEDQEYGWNEWGFITNLKKVCDPKGKYHLDFSGAFSEVLSANPTVTKRKKK